VKIAQKTAVFIGFSAWLGITHYFVQGYGSHSPRVHVHLDGMGLILGIFQVVTWLLYSVLKYIIFLLF